MKKIVLLLIISTVSYVSKAQFTQNLRGTIVDKITQGTLPGANISIRAKDKSFGTTSNHDGMFVFNSIPIGKYDLAVSFIGYDPVLLRNLEVRSGKEIVLTIELIEKVIKVEEVVVAARANGETRNKMAALSARQFSVKETEKYAGSWGDPSRMASNFAGVITANDSRNDIIIRGNSPQGLLWRLEGINIPNPNHFGALGSTGGPVSMLNNNLLANSDFFTGAFPAEYGNALSGVFDLRLRNGNSSKHEFTGQAGFGGLELGVEGPVSRKHNSSYMVNYRYSIPGLMNVLGFSTSEGAVPYYQDLSFKFNLPLKNAGTLSIWGIGGKSSIEFLDEGNSSGSTYDILSNTRTRNGSTSGIIAVTHRFSPDEKSHLFTALSTSYTAVHTQIDSVAEGRPDKRFYGEGNQETKLSFTTRYTRKLNSRNTFNLGGSFESYSIDLADSVTGEVYNPPRNGEYIYDLNTQENGLNLLQLYSEWQHRFGEKLTLYGGLNFQEFLFNSTYAIDPRFNLSYRISPSSKMSLAYGKHSQIQAFFNYFVEDFNTETSLYEKTNMNLGLSKADHFVAGFDHHFTRNLKLKIETYYQWLYNVPVHENYGYFSMVNAGNSFHQERISNLVNGGTGRNYGLELTLEKYLENNYYFLINTSLFDSKYQGSDQVWRNTEFNTNFVLNALGGYEIPINQRLSIDLNFRTIWSGGKRNPYIDLAKSIEKGEAIFDHSKDYSFREKDYFKIDFRASILLNGKKITQEWALDLTNLSNHKNIYSRSYNAKNQSIEYVYQQGFYPMFLYRINF